MKKKKTAHRQKNAVRNRAYRARQKIKFQQLSPEEQAEIKNKNSERHKKYKIAQIEKKLGVVDERTKTGVAEQYLKNKALKKNRGKSPGR